MRFIVLTLLIVRCSLGDPVRLEWDAPLPSSLHARDAQVDEYVVKYGIKPGVWTLDKSAGTNTSLTITGLVAGVRYYFVVVAKNGTNESVVSNEVAHRPLAATNPPVRLELDAERAELIPPMGIVDMFRAISDKGVATTNLNAGECRFTFQTPFADNFIIWARVFCPNAGRDSFVVRGNTGYEDIYDCAKVPTNQWQWTVVNGRGGVNRPFDASYYIEPRIFELDFGMQTISFIGREAYTVLDAIVVTNDRRFVPTEPDPPTDLKLTVE